MAIPIKALLSIDGLVGVAKGVGNLTKALVGLAAKFAAVLTVVTALSAAFGYFVLRQAAVIDRIGKVSKVTGFAVDSLQELRIAAELAGVSSDQLDVALRRFARRLGEAQRNTGELLPALKRLGISVRDGNGNLRSGEEVLLDFAQGVSKTRGETAKLSLAFKAFDSEGAELVQILEEGREGLEQFLNISEALGLTISAQTIRATEALNDELLLLRKTISTLFAEVVGQLSPGITELARIIRLKLLENVNDTNQSFDTLADIISDSLLVALEKLALGFLTLYNVFAQAFNPIITSLSFLDGLELTNLRKNLKDFQDIAGNTTLENLLDLRNWQVTAGAAADVLEREFGTANILLTPENVRRAIRAIETEIKRLERAGVQDLMLPTLSDEDFAKVREYFNMFREMFVEGEVIGPFQVDEIEEVVTKAKQLDTILSFIFGKQRTADFWNDWYDTGVGALTKFGAIAKLILGEQLFDNLRESLQGLVGEGGVIKTLTEGLTKAAVMFEDALAQAVINGKADFDDLAKHLRTVLAKALVQKFITGPIFALFGLAKGGPAKKGQPYIVGEEGPELFVPKQSGTVVPNNMLGTMAGGPAVGMGGGTVINISAVDTQSFQTAIARDPEFIYNVSRAGARRTPG